MTNYKNPNGSVVSIYKGRGALIESGARIGADAQIGADARILLDIAVPKGLNGATFLCGQYVATVNEDIIVIGCYQKTIAEWLKVSQDESIKLGLREELYPQYKAFVEMVARFKEAKDEKESV